MATNSDCVAHRNIDECVDHGQIVTCTIEKRLKKRTEFKIVTSTVYDNKTNQFSRITESVIVLCWTHKALTRTRKMSEK